MKRFIIVGLAIILLASCAPSPQATETGTETPAPAYTAEPGSGNLAGISKSAYVDTELQDKLDMTCEESVSDDGLFLTGCTATNFEEEACSIINVKVGGLGEDTVDIITVIAAAHTTIESHEDCQNVLYQIAGVPYTGSTPDEAVQWVQGNIGGITLGSETKIDTNETFNGINFRLTADSGVYSLFIE